MKKAMAASMLAALIIALVFTGIGAKLIQKIDKGTSKGYDKQLCKQSVVLNAKGRLPLANTEAFTLDCPTRYVTFYDDEYITESRTYEYEKEIKCGKLNKRNDQECYLKEANKAISKLMFDCWDQFAAGRLEVLDAWDEGRQCVICSRFEFSADVQEAFEDSVGDLEIRYTEFRDDDNVEKDFTLDNYMRSHNPSLHKISYYEFSMDPIDAFKFPFYDYNLKEPYAIVFKAVNKNQAARYGEKIWQSMKEHDLTIPFTKFNINPLYEGEGGQEEEEDLEFVNIMELIKYSEVSAECDSLS